MVIECIAQIADAVSSRSSKEDSNLVIFLESEHLQVEERERIRQEKDDDEIPIVIKDFQLKFPSIDSTQHNFIRQLPVRSLVKIF
jgi:DNA transposition AAA+ family ATPase